MPCQRLAMHLPFIFAQGFRSDPLVELVCVGKPGGENLVEAVNASAGGLALNRKRTIFYPPGGTSRR